MTFYSDNTAPWEHNSHRDDWVRLKIDEAYPQGRVARVVAVNHPGTFTGSGVTEKQGT